MKKYIALSTVLSFITIGAFAQAGSPEQLAANIAQKMKDTLSLTDSQRVQVYHINIQLHQQKMLAWQQYSNSDSTIRVHLQQIENTRDSLYRPVLTEDKYFLYQLKKRSLVNNN